jgi:hypothetical protein
MTPEQILAVKCAYADLLGAQQAHEQGDHQAHDWRAHRQTLSELVTAFPDIEFEPLE